MGDLFETVYLVTMEWLTLAGTIKCLFSHQIQYWYHFSGVLDQWDLLKWWTCRAEQSTKVYRIDFVDAHGPSGLI